MNLGETADDFFRHLERRGIQIKVERIWWHQDDRYLLRVRDPMFCMTPLERKALRFWEADLKARIEEWTSPAESLPSTWFHPGTGQRGVIDVPIQAIAGAEIVHMILVDHLWKCETI